MDNKTGGKVYTKSDFCNSCLSEDGVLQKYSFPNELFKTYFQENDLTLCKFCKRLAQHWQLFVQNVEIVQKLFDQYPTIDFSILNSARNSIEPTIKLTSSVLPTVETSIDEDQSVEDGIFTVYSYEKSCKNVEIKREVKIEPEAACDTFYYEYMDEDLHHSNFECVKEDELDDIIKKEVLSESTNTKSTKKKRMKSTKSIRRKLRKKNRLETDIKHEFIQMNRSYAGKMQLIHLTEKECLAEKLKMAEDEKYLNLPLKCRDCVKGFSFKSTYERHMEKHNVNNGKYVCKICKLRTDTLQRLNMHKKYHQIRFKCLVCSFVGVCKRTVRNHYAIFHSTDGRSNNCQYCHKAFKQKEYLLKHIKYCHNNNGRVVCDYCQRSYANKQVLRSHMLNKHTLETGVELPRKSYCCQHCGKDFKAPSLLKNHLLRHSEQRNYYCVECDKSFKSSTILQRHLKTAVPHVNYAELPFPCLHCEKKFSIRRDLERHMNSIHLNVKPYQCDKCEKAYVSNWSLKEHIGLVHEGFKRPLKFPCPMCDKIFDRNQILKSHLRTHTGERPFECSKCPAKFSQSSILQTHVKLIHLKLTRNGKAKGH